jgi:hypothetical protein
LLFVDLVVDPSHIHAMADCNTEGQQLAHEFDEQKESELAQYLREQYFAHHCCQTARLNHGSFGCVPESLLNAAEALRKSWYAQPDVFYFAQLDQRFEKPRYMA